MQDQWFYVKDGQQYGPVTLAQLKQLATSGRLRRDDLLWSEGMGNWSPASQVLEVFGAASAGPPPPPLSPQSPAGVMRSATPSSSLNPYQTPQYAAAPATSDGGTMATVGFILGMFALVAWCIPLFGLPVSVTGLVLAIKGRKSTQAGFAIAGMVLNSIGLVLTLINAALGAMLAFSGNHALVNRFMHQ